VLPIADTLKGFTGSVFESFLAPYFSKAYRPVRQGDQFTVDEGTWHVEFKVIKVDPPEHAIVAQDTVIHYEGDPIQNTEEAGHFDARSDKAPCAVNRLQTYQINCAMLSVPFIFVRLIYTLLNGLDNQLLDSIARAAMVVLMEVFIMNLFSIMDFCALYVPVAKDHATILEEGK
jgi:hypothetical protein